MNKVPSDGWSIQPEHIIALEPMDKGLMERCCRYPYEVRRGRVFDDIQDVKSTKDMLDLARHPSTRGGPLRAGQFETSNETALLDPHQPKRAGTTHHAKARPRGRERGGPDGCAAQKHPEEARRQ